MITSVNDYKLVYGANVDALHPHGDLDRIGISGSVHPRSGGRLRGEPIAFMWECLLGRAELNNGGGQTHEFKLSMAAADLRGAVTQFNRLFTNYMVYPSAYVSGRESHDISGGDDQTLWRDMYWNGQSKYPIPEPELTRPIVAEDVTYILDLLGNWFQSGRQQPTYNRGDYYLDGSVTKSSGYPDDPPPIDWYRGFGYVVYWYCLGVVPGGMSTWEYYVMNLRGQGTLRVKFENSSGQPLSHIKSVRLIYKVSWNNSGLDENSRPFGSGGHTSLVMGSGEFTPDQNGVINVDLFNDIPKGGMTQAYGSPTMRTPRGTPGSSSTHFECMHYIQLQSIAAVVTLDDKIRIT